MYLVQSFPIGHVLSRRFDLGTQRQLGQVNSVFQRAVGDGPPSSRAYPPARGDCHWLQQVEKGIIRNIFPDSHGLVIKIATVWLSTVKEVG